MCLLSVAQNSYTYLMNQFCVYHDLHNIVQRFSIGDASWLSITFQERAHSMGSYGCTIDVCVREVSKISKNKYVFKANYIKME